MSRVPHNVNQNERILYSTGKANFVHCLEGFKLHSCEDKEEVEELLEDESI